MLCLTSTNTATNDTTNTNTTTNNNTYLRIANFLLILSFCYALYYITFSVPYLPSFNFPWYATVVKDDGLLGVLRPLLIESSQIPFVDEMKEKKLYAPFLLFLSLYILFVIARYLKSNVSENKYLSYLLIFFLLSFLIECFLPINISIIMPFKAIWRTVPSIYTFSLYPIFLFFILFTFFIFTILNLKNFIFIYLLNIILSVLVSFNNFKPLLISDTATNFMSNVIKGDLLNSEFKNIILSPSSSTIKALGFQYLTKKDIVFNKRMQRNIKILNPTLSSNYGENTLKQILDRNPKSRYSTLKTRQDGDEWIKISLPKSYSIHGVILDTGDYRTDFPTSILITTCDDKKIAEQVNLGQIEYTSLGYPYYGGQSNMKIVFEDIVKTDCIKIYQTGKNKHYEWSIAKIKFILPDMERKKNKKDKEKNKKEK
ncbi:MAG: discoidin domain-containing protein [Bdellovibrionota bacterium]